MKKMNPIMSSVLALVVVLIITMVILYFLKPNFVKTTSDPKDKKIAWDKLIAYSGLIAILVAIVVLLVSPGGRMSAMTGSPSYASKFKYCGSMH